MRPPALSRLSVWQVEREGEKIFVRRRLETPRAASPRATAAPGKIVIVGGGAAGFAAAEMLRRRGFRGSIVMLSNDAAPPVDRPNLSKDYLAGSAPKDWLPLRPDAFYPESGIELHLGTEVVGINVKSREVLVTGGKTLPYDKLLLATGAAPVRLQIPGADQPHVFIARRLPSHHRRRQQRSTRTCDRGEFYRIGSRSVTARTQH